MLNEEPFMGLTKDSLPKDPSCCALWDLLYAYEMIGESPKRLTHMRGGIWVKAINDIPFGKGNPNARGSLAFSISRALTC